MYMKCGRCSDALPVFMSSSEQKTVAYNAIITGLVENEQVQKAYEMFQLSTNVSAGSYDRKTHSLTPDDFTYTRALSACAGLASSISGRQIHGNLIRTRLSHDTGVANALVNMYAKRSSIKHAVTTFNQMEFRNLVFWNTLMAGSANHGYGKHALELFDQMKKLKTKPDSVKI
ncbi:putative tetratricopeptide-like helical domain superfamily [Helianthus anomalus]